MEKKEKERRHRMIGSCNEFIFLYIIQNMMCKVPNSTVVVLPQEYDGGIVSTVTISMLKAI